MSHWNVFKRFNLIIITVYFCGIYQAENIFFKFILVKCCFKKKNSFIRRGGPTAGEHHEYGWWTGGGGRSGGGVWYREAEITLLCASDSRPDAKSNMGRGHGDMRVHVMGRLHPAG